MCKIVLCLVVILLGLDVAAVVAVTWSGFAIEVATIYIVRVECIVCPLRLS